jgi:hypothetical protein
MHKVLKPSNPDCSTPLPELFGICIFTLVFQEVFHEIFPSEFSKKKKKLEMYILHLYHSYYNPPPPSHFLDFINKIVISDEETYKWGSHRFLQSCVVPSSMQINVLAPCSANPKSRFKFFPKCERTRGKLFGNILFETRCSVVDWGAMLQAGKSRVRVPMRSLNFFKFT